MNRWLILLWLYPLSLTQAQRVFDYEQQLGLPETFVRQEIECTNPIDGVVLSGTLIYPSEGFNKVIIMVPGSGKDTRHSHFKLAESLLRQQIAVYRFDERGVGKSGGKYNPTATSLQKDVIAVYQQLKQEELLSNKQIGVFGHSLGGIASIGALGEGCSFDFLLQMATPVENKGAFLQYQVTMNIVGFYTVPGKTPEEVIHFINVVRDTVQANEDYKTSKKKLKPIIKELDFQKGRHLLRPAIIDLMKQNHEETYQTSEAPILYIIGSDDNQVSSTQAIRTLERLNNPNIRIALIEGGDHYLRDEDGPSEPKSPLYNITQEACEVMINWILAL